jgi:aminopeptidase N
MRWWSDLWLNESFATIMGKVAMARHPVLKERYPNIWLNFFYYKEFALNADEKPTTHPVLMDVPDTDVAQTIFDGKISLWASQLIK